MAKYWLAFDIGCIECGEGSSVIGVYKTEEAADAACDKEEERQKANWGGEHRMESYEIEVP